MRGHDAPHAAVSARGEKGVRLDLHKGRGPMVGLEKETRLLGSFRKSPEHLDALDRVDQWTRARFSLPGHMIVVVSEIECGLPGCPPLETVVAFWTDEDTRHHFKIFKPVADVVEDDLPPAFMKPALVVDETAGWACC